MPRRLKAGIWAALAAACCVPWLLGRSAVAPGVADGSSTESPRRTTESPSETAVAAGTTGRGEATPKVPAPPSIAELRQLCGWPWLGAFGPECLGALENRYAREPALGDESFYSRPRIVFDTAMLGRSVTWGEVFEDPVGTLARVEDALGRPECHAAEGDFRFDLREACVADDMARLAILRRECANLLWNLGYANEESPGTWSEGSQGVFDNLERRQAKWDLAVDRANGSDDTAEYHPRRERLEDAWLGAMWRAGKCRALPRESLNALGPFFGATAWPQRVPDTGLIETAARLGSEWALSVVLSGGARGGFAAGKLRKAHALPVDDATLAELQSARPVLVELLRMWKNIDGLAWGAAEPKRAAAHVAMLAHALAALEVAAALGLHVDGDAVLRTVSGRASKAQVAAAMVRAPRWLTEQGWTVVVAAGEDGGERVFESPDQVRGEDPWGQWWDADRVSVWPGPSATPAG